MGRKRRRRLSQLFDTCSIRQTATEKRANFRYHGHMQHLKGCKEHRTIVLAVSCCNGPAVAAVFSTSSIIPWTMFGQLDVHTAATGSKGDEQIQVGMRANVQLRVVLNGMQVKLSSLPVSAMIRRHCYTSARHVPTATRMRMINALGVLLRLVSDLVRHDWLLRTVTRAETDKSKIDSSLDRTSRVERCLIEDSRSRFNPRLLHDSVSCRRWRVWGVRLPYDD
ncbi:hypothetical protein KCU76_g12, partial [Aureobasidium melanogenum]